MVTVELVMELHFIVFIVGAVVGIQKKKLEDVAKEFVELLSATPGQQLPLK